MCMNLCIVNKVMQGSGEGGRSQCNAYKCREIMNGTVGDDRKRIYTELRRSGHALVIPLTKNKTHG